MKSNKIVSIIVSLLILCGSIFALSSCGSGNPVAGTWETKIKADDIFSAEFFESVADDKEAAKEIFKNINISDKLTYRMELKEDGSYTDLIVESDIEKFAKNFAAQTADGMIKYSIDQIARETGNTVSEEDVLAELGYNSKDAMINELAEKYETGMKSGSAGSGTYSYKDGVLEFDDASYTVELKEDSLIYTGVTSADGSSSLSDDMFPMVFTKVN